MAALSGPARAPAAPRPSDGGDDPAAAAAAAGAIAAATADAARDLLLLLAFLGHARTAGGWAPVDAHWAALAGVVAPQARRPRLLCYTKQQLLPDRTCF